MSIKESRRPTFEQAVIDRMKEGGFLEVEIRVECLARSGDGYYDGSVDAYWHFWNTALDGVVMELPLAWKPQGEANFYAITENGNWLAIVQLNGELLREEQEEWMRLFTGQNMRITEAKAPSVTDEQAAFEAAVAAVNERGWSTSTDLARQIWNAARLNAAPVQQASPPPWAAEFDTPAEFLAHQLLIKRSALLGRPLTWREAIELTALTTNMPEGQKQALLAMDDPVPVQQVSVPQCVLDWFEAKQAHVTAVDAYNARLTFVREHMPFGTSVDPEYQIMEAADRKVRNLVGPMFNGLRDLAAAQATPRQVSVPDGLAAEIERAAKFVEAVRECERLASSYCGTLDGVEEHGGDDHEDPTCAIWHRLYYAMFDGDKVIAELRQLAASPAAPAADAGDIVLNASAQEILSQCIGAHAYVLGVLANGRPDLAFTEAKKWVDAFKKAATQMEPSHD